MPTRDATPFLRRIPSLDGLRAVSILMVIALHSVQRWGRGPFALRVAANGALGVYIFFVISGYLITSLLLSEFEKRGSISLRAFYLRRAFRILPPLYFYVGVLALMAAFGFGEMSWRDALPTLLFYRNYSPNHIWTLQHTWSLCIEEQFYLIWPFIFAWCLRKTPLEEGKRKAARVALWIICLSPVLRIASYALPHSMRLGTMFHLRADSLMFGCFVALAAETPRFERFYAVITRFWWLPPVMLFVVLSALEVRFENYWDYPLGYSLEGLFAAIFLLWCVRNAGSLIGRVLNLGFVTWIGVLSYSLYIWQTLFLHDFNLQVFHRREWWNIFPGNWLAVLGAACLSYYVLEQPALTLRNRVQKRLRLYRTSRPEST